MRSQSKSFATELGDSVGSSIFDREAKGGGSAAAGAGARGAGTGARAGAATAASRSGSIKPPTVGALGGTPRGLDPPIILFVPASSDNHRHPAIGGNNSIVSFAGDDPKSLCPMITGIGDTLAGNACTINGGAAMPIYNDLTTAWAAIQGAQDPDQYAAAITKFGQDLHSLQETDCGGTKMFKTGDHLKLGATMGSWADYFEKPKHNPMYLYQLPLSCSQQTPYMVSTGIMQKQIDEATKEAENICDALSVVHDTGTLAGQDSKVIVTDVISTMSLTPYTDDVASILRPKIELLKGAKVEGTEDGLNALQKCTDWLSDADPSKAAQGRMALGTASYCESDATGGVSLVLPSLGSVAFVAGMSALAVV